MQEVPSMTSSIPYLIGGLALMLAFMFGAFAWLAGDVIGDKGYLYAAPSLVLAGASFVTVPIISTIGFIAIRHARQERDRHPQESRENQNGVSASSGPRQAPATDTESASVQEPATVGS